jgi:ferrochelatase
MAVTIPRPTPAPFDAVLLISFGGPQGLDDIRPFLANVLRGRRIPPARIEEVAHHYELFGGISPITDLTLRQAAGLGQRLERDGPPLPVYVGMRNWHPLLADTLRDMAAAGVRRAVGFILAAHRSYSSCEQYRRNVAAARREIRAEGGPDVEVTYVGDWHTHDGFISACAAQAEMAREALPEALRDGARLVFTAHSIPLSMADESPYHAQLLESARLVAARLDVSEWALVFQSRSGRPQDPWLEPDICDYLRAERPNGLESVVLCPLGFVADHVEVLYDLDHEAAEVCGELGITMRRAAAVNDNPHFLDLMADMVRGTVDRYRGGRPLPICPATEELTA